MQWTIVLEYPGTPARDHGPVTQLTDGPVSITSVMICGSDGAGYSQMALVVEADGEDEARQAALAVGDRWAREVNIPGPAAVMHGADHRPVGRG